MPPVALKYRIPLCGAAIVPSAVAAAQFQWPSNGGITGLGAGIVNARLDAAEGNVRVGVIQGIGNLSQLRHALVTPHRLSLAIADTRLHLLP